MSWQHIAAEVIFASAGIYGAAVMIRTIREALPRIKQLIKELENE